MDKNESALVIIKIATKLVSPYIVLSQEYYSRIFDPRKEVAPIIKKKKKKKDFLLLILVSRALSHGLIRFSYKL